MFPYLRSALRCPHFQDQCPRAGDQAERSAHGLYSVFVEYFWRHVGMQFARVFILMLLFSGCLGKNQGEVRAMPPSHTGTFEQPYAQLAACAKANVETDSWAFGEPIVQSTHETAQPLIRLTASYLGSALFEVSFQPIPAVMTLVEYRHGYDGYDTQEQTWAIIERCAHQLAPPKYRVPSLPHKAS